MVFSANRSPPGMAMVTMTSGGGAPLASESFADHRTGRRIDRWLADRELQPRSRHRADSLAGREAYAGAGIGPGDLGNDGRAVGDIRIIAGILDDAGAGEAAGHLGKRQREARLVAARQTDRDGIGKFAGQQRGVRGPRSGRGTSASRPTSTQRTGFLPCHRMILAKPALLTTFAT
jgi:hypothetical protein